MDFNTVDDFKAYIKENFDNKTLYNCPRTHKVNGFQAGIQVYRVDSNGMFDDVEIRPWYYYDTVSYLYLPVMKVEGVILPRGGAFAREIYIRKEEIEHLKDLEGKLLNELSFVTKVNLIPVTIAMTDVVEGHDVSSNEIDCYRVDLWIDNDRHWTKPTIIWTKYENDEFRFVRSSQCQRRSYHAKMNGDQTQPAPTDYSLKEWLTVFYTQLTNIYPTSIPKPSFVGTKTEIQRPVALKTAILKV